MNFEQKTWKCFWFWIQHFMCQKRHMKSRQLLENFTFGEPTRPMKILKIWHFWTFSQIFNQIANENFKICDHFFLSCLCFLKYFSLSKILTRLSKLNYLSKLNSTRNSKTSTSPSWTPLGNRVHFGKGDQLQKPSQKIWWEKNADVFVTDVNANQQTNVPQLILQKINDSLLFH